LLYSISTTLHVNAFSCQSDFIELKSSSIAVWGTYGGLGIGEAPGTKRPSAWDSR
jgi:hypothetical protein